MRLAPVNSQVKRARYDPLYIRLVVLLREEPAKLMAVRSYSGRWTEANYREHESLLLAAVEKAGLKPVVAPVCARYNSPFSLPFIRCNETMLEVWGVEWRTVFWNTRPW